MKARFLRSGITAEIQPIEHCTTCGGGRPVRLLDDGNHVCQACRTVIGPLSPLEHYMATHGVAAMQEATREVS